MIVTIDDENYDQGRVTRDQTSMLPFIMENDIDRVTHRKRTEETVKAVVNVKPCLSVYWTKECSKCGYMNLNTSYGGLLANCCYGGR